MKKRLRRMFSVLLAGLMMFSTLTLTAAAEGEEYQMFLGFGGDFTAGSWDAAPSEAVTASAKVGDTVTIGLKFDSPVVYTWWMAPVIVAENVKDLSYTIESVKLDGKDVTADLDLSIGDKEWWYEGTSDTNGTEYDNTQAIRLKGGYNEWADKYFAVNDKAPNGYKEIMYTIKLNGLTAGAAAAGAPVPSTETYHAFLAIGAEAVADTWDSQYYGEGNSGNADGAVAVEGELKNGETTVLSVTFPETITKTWFVAPCFITDDTDSISGASTFDVKVLLDGKEIATDMSAGKSCWAEDTGDYKGNCMRIGGGYNEWGDKYLAESPSGYKTIEFQITPNIMIGGAAAVLSDAEYPAFLAIGAGQDWGYQYYGNGCGDNSGVAEAVDGVLKSGQTTTLSVTFAGEADYTWFVAPCMVIDNPASLAAESTFDVKVYVDGEEVPTDLTAGDMFWAEGTGEYADNCVRIAGGYNEWAAKYIAESPAGYTTISFEITPQIYIAEAAEEEEYVSAAGPVDLNGTYHAYLGMQTPKYSFRNAFDDGTYGRDTSEVFYQVTGWDADSNAVTLPGSFTDVEIAGNGTYTVSVDGLDFPEGEFADQDYMNLIFLSTDIPNTKEITISDVTLKIDGKAVDLAGGGALLSPDSKDYINMLLQNIWNDDVKTIGYYAVPFSSMSITFKVDGFAYDAAPASADTAPAETAPADAAPAADTPVPAEESGSGSTAVVVVVVIVVVAAAACAGVVISKKKKK